jgi:amidase
MSEDLAFAGAVALGRLIARRKISSLEATRAMLARIERLEPTLRAYVRVLGDDALAEAKRADSALRRGKPKSPLHGVPLAVKDLCDIAGQPTTAGIPALGDHAKSANATVVDRLKAAGAVILGKLKLTEGAMSLHHPDVPPPVNPWRAEISPGVSSSGSGVAVAAGVAYGAIGTDTGGSIRFPSQANGIVGVKPTWGRVSRAGIFPLAETLDHVGPMTRRVEDAAAMLGAMAGADPRDPTAAAEQVPDYLRAIGRGLKGVRIGFDAAYCEENVDPEIAKAVRRALRVLKGAGAIVRAVTMPPTEDALASWLKITVAEAAFAHRATWPARREIYGPFFSRLLEGGNAQAARAYAECAIIRRVLKAGMHALFNDIELMIMPVTPMPSLTLADIEARIALADTSNRFIRFTAPTDITGYPTIALPCGFLASGTPVGFQLAARPFEETRLFQAGAVWQKEADWSGQQPTGAA